MPRPSQRQSNLCQCEAQSTEARSDPPHQSSGTWRSAGERDVPVQIQMPHLSDEFGEFYTSNWDDFWCTWKDAEGDGKDNAHREGLANQTGVKIECQTLVHWWSFNVSYCKSLFISPFYLKTCFKGIDSRPIPKIGACGHALCTRISREDRALLSIGLLN